MKLLYIPFLFITFSSFAQNFTPENSPIEFNGTLEHFRTVWFSSDNKSVYGDGKSIIGFDMNTGRQIINVPIEGYCVHPSSQSRGRRYWIQGNSNYNDPANPQITNMHNNLGFYDISTEVMKAQKTDGISLSIVKHSTKRNTAYGIVRKSNVESIIEFQIDPFKIIRTIAKENTGTYILGLDIDESLGLLSYSHAGNSKGVKFVEMEGGTAKKKLSINEEFSPIEFSPDGTSLIAAAYSKLYKIDIGTYGFKSFDLDPDKDKSYAFSISVHHNNRSVAYSSKYGTSIIDTKNGDVQKIDDRQSMACAFSQDGKHLATSVKPMFSNESSCLIVFTDNRFGYQDPPPPPVEETIDPDLKVYENEFEELTPTPPPPPPPPPPPIEETTEHVHEAPEPDFEEFILPDIEMEWYKHRDENLAIEFPDKPKIETKITDKGLRGSTYMCPLQSAGYMAFVNQMPKKIKARKYKKTAEEMGRVFVAKIAPQSSSVNAYFLSGQEGVQYRFTKGGLNYEYRCICINGNAYQVICLNAEEITR